MPNSIEHVCICCSMPSNDLRDMRTCRINLIDSGHIEICKAYEQCSGIYMSQHEPIQNQPYICTVCAIRLEYALKFYDLCQRTRKTFDFSKANYAVCLACSFPDLLDDELFDMDGKQLNNCGLLMPCTEAFSQYSNIEIQPSECGKMCGSCFLQLEESLQFRSFCHHAFRIMTIKYEVLLTNGNVEEQLMKAKNFDDTSIPSQPQIVANSPIIAIMDELKETPTDTKIIPTTVKKKRTLLSGNPRDRYAKKKDPFICAFCDNTFLRFSKIEKHIVNKHSAKHKKEPLLCPDCGFLCAVKSTLDTHMDTHRTTKHKCAICPASYKYLKDLTRHTLEQHQEGGRPGFSNCPICKKSLKTYSVERHIKLIHENKKIVCDICGRSFRNQEAFLNHEFDHLGFSPYNCPELNRDGVLCHFKSKLKNAFVYHLHKKHNVRYNAAVHESNVDVAKHMSEVKARIYLVGLKHKCPMCDKAFKTGTGLNHHKNVVHFKILYECAFVGCNKKFTAKPTLWQHCFVHRDFHPFNCCEPQCEYKSYTKKSFEFHLKSQHDILYNEKKHGYKGETFQQVMSMFLKKKTKGNPKIENTVGGPLM